MAGKQERQRAGEGDADGRTRALEMNPISRETAARLDRFVTVLRRWQPIVPLVSASTYPALWTRHVGDSLSSFGFRRRPVSGSILDRAAAFRGW